MKNQPIRSLLIAELSGINKSSDRERSFKHVLQNTLQTKNVLIVFLLFSSIIGHAQSNPSGVIIGANNVVMGDQITYSFQSDFELWSQEWEIDNGTIMWTSNPSPNYYEVSVYWTVSGTGAVRFKDSGFVMAELGITIRPYPPAVYASTSITVSSFVANWNPFTTATSFRLDVSTSSSFGSFVTGYNNLSVSSTSHTVTGLSAGSTYYYRVRTVNGSLISDNSSVITTLTLPNAPTNYVASNITTSSFTANWSSVGSATSYRLDVSASSDFSSFVSGYNDLTVGGTSQSVTGLSAGTTYYYQARAVNGSGVSSNSGTTTTLTLPGAPSANTASSITETSFTANWSSVTSATSYRLDVSTASNFGSFVSGYNNLTVGATSQSITGLSPGTVYYYRVRAVNSTGTSANSNTGTALSLPAAPGATAASSISTTFFTANWNSVQSATSYRLDVSAASDFSSFVSGYNNLTVNSTSQSVSGLSAGTTYYYRVRAVNGSGTSSNSNTITTLTLPSAPSANSGSSITTTSFTASWNSVTSATSYRLDVSTASNFASFVSGYNNLTVASTSQSVTGLVAGTTYYYRVRAVNGTGTSANSNVPSVLTLPAAPSANPGSSIAATSFTASWAGVTSATSYNLDVSLSSSFGSFLSGYNNLSVGSTSQSVSGLSAGTTHYYRVRAVNGSGTSANSSTITVLTLPPSPTANAASSVAASSFTANWSSDASASSYKLDVSSSSDFSTFVSGYNNLTVAGTSQSVTGISPGTNYYYRVRAVNGSGTSANSSTTSLLTLPAAPVASAASTITTTSFTANWGSVTSATGYRLDVSSASDFSSFVSGFNNLTVSTTSQSVTGLTAGITYYYRIRAVNGTGTSANSNTISTITVSPAPVATAASSIAATSFTANWNTTTGAASYRLDVSTASDFSSFVSGYNNLTVSAGTSQSVTSLIAGTTYYYRVRAVNASGTSSNSGVITALTLPASPVSTAATSITVNSFTANWNSVTSATSYRLDVSTASNFSSFVSGYDNLSVGSTSQNVTGLAAGVPYYYRVRAVNGSGNSANSGTITTLTLPGAPAATAATSIGTTAFTANWGSVPSASGYRLDVSTASNFSSFVSGYNNLTVIGNTHIVSGMSAGTVYYYRVRAVNSTGTSANSNTISLITIAAPPMATEASNVGSQSFTANWNSVSGAASYLLDVSTSSSFSAFVSGYNSLSVTGTSYNVTGLTQKTTYYYRLRAANASGASSYSNVIFVIDLDRHYVLTNDVLTSGITTESQVNALTGSSVMSTYNFVDGLGRPLQTVMKQQSPSGKDIVQPVVYDIFGRETVKYLPYASGNDGWLKPDFVAKENSGYSTSPHAIFYQNTAEVAHDNAPYSITVVEESPLARPIKVGSPGTAWQPDGTNTYASTDHTIKTSNDFNGSSEVLMWSYTDPTSSQHFGLISAGSASSPIYYAPYELYKNSTKDAEQHEVIQYTDKEGRVVLRRLQAGASTTVNDTNYASTYYIYNDLGQLVCVVPPEAVKRLPAEYHHSSATDVTKENFLKQWAFRYTFDDKGRMIKKQAPGAAPLFMVYDSRDRLVLTQDGNQRNMDQWSFTKYDQLNRPVLTGFYYNPNTQDSVQNVVDAYYETIGSGQAYSETYISDTAADVLGYDNASFPQITAEAAYLTATYYDRYDSYIKPSAYEYQSQSLPGQLSQPYVPVVGMVTAARIRILDTQTWLRSVNYYDDKMRVVQVVSDHQKGIVRTGSVIDFAGKVLYTKRDYTVNSVTSSVKETFTYDNARRLLTAKHSINGGTDYTILKNKYNELGQLVDKKLHSTNGVDFLQSVDSRYNIRGWLTSINNSALSNDGVTNDDATDFFGMNMEYNTTSSGIGNSGLFNGNISAITWSNSLGLGATKQNGSLYSYDAMNRLTGSSFKEKGATTWTALSNSALAESNITYDMNGNIQGLSRNDKRSGATMMDVLGYTYGSGNKLSSVTDSGDAATGFKDGNTSGNDYEYDDNGNLIADANKSITLISYNHLNLPDTVRNNSGNYIVYGYDASGRKLSQKVFNGSNALQKETDYIGEYVYEGNALQFVNHAEGRAVMTGSAPEYEYHLKDHLGNVRLTFTSKPDTTQRTAGFETVNQPSEAAYFKNYPSGGMINTISSNAHTGTNSMLLNGGYSGQLGVAKSFSVMPGDVVKIEGYARWETPSSTNANLSGFASALLSSFNLPAPAGGESGTASAAMQSWGGLVAGGTAHGGDEGAPKLFVTIVLFDRNYNFIDASFQQFMSQNALYSTQYLVKEAGYAYLYVSNEHSTLVNAYFDDISISQTQSPVVQVNDYYPFGLTFNSSQRENSPDQNYLYNGKEIQDELALGWYDYQARQYDPVIGRWMVVDPAGDMMRRHSPYNYAFDNPLRFIDPDGMIPKEKQGIDVTAEGGSEGAEGGSGECGDKPCPNKQSEKPKKDSNNFWDFLPEVKIEMNVTVGAQIGVTIGDIASADLTVMNVELMNDKAILKDGKLKGQKKLGTMEISSESDGVKDSGAKMTNKVGLTILGFGGEIGQEQNIFGETLSSDYKSYTKSNFQFGRGSSKIVEEKDFFGNKTSKQESGFTLGLKAIFGVELKFQLVQSSK